MKPFFATTSYCLEDQIGPAALDQEILTTIRGIRLMKLPEALMSQIEACCREGDRLAEEGMHDQAISQFQGALRLIPEPKSDWEASTWILAALGDSSYLKQDYYGAATCLREAMYCPNAIGNPFIHLRLGQVEFELGNLEAAADELARAFMGGGKDIFRGEDPKYLDLLLKNLDGLG